VRLTVLWRRRHKTFLGAFLSWRHGLKETEASIANKIIRGAFPTTFFLATLVAIGVEAVKLEDI
jgi:hypothetical protein